MADAKSRHDMGWEIEHKKYYQKHVTLDNKNFGTQCLLWKGPKIKKYESMVFDQTYSSPTSMWEKVLCTSLCTSLRSAMSFYAEWPNRWYDVVTTNLRYYIVTGGIMK